MKSFFIIPLFVSLGYLKATPKLGTKLHLKRLFFGKLNLWTEYEVLLIPNFDVADKQQSGRNLTKTQASLNLLFYNK